MEAFAAREHRALGNLGKVILEPCVRRARTGTKMRLSLTIAVESVMTSA
jgi:hypothetical protein